MVTEYDARECVSTPDDVPGEPAKCVIAHHVRKIMPWARHITVGERTIRVYDYRCEHNPDGKMADCDKCAGRCLVWSTPQTAKRAIKKYDREGFATFPAFKLREDEAEVLPARQDRLRKREQSRRRRERIAAGEHKPNKVSGKAKARAMSDRRKG